MKKLILVVFFFVTLITPYNKAQALDPKGKAFMIICTYGTVGGALLGFASMAFGTNSRAIAQGASLGLYAGIGFGAYVITSHKRSMEQPVSPEPGYGQQPGPPPGYGAGDQYGSPGGFGDQPAGGSGFGAPTQDDSDGGGFFGSPQRAYEISEELVYNYKLKSRKGRSFSLPIYVPLYHAAF
jgi:hypothetical protein